MNNCVTPYQFYSEYHQNPINKLIHFVTIPLIVITTLSLVSNLQIKLTSTIYKQPRHSFGVDNIAWSMDSIDFKGDSLLTLFYIFYYSTWKTPLNIIMFIYCLSMLIISRSIKQMSFYWNGLDLLIFIVAWILQFAGHSLFEGNRPALMDSLSQAFLTAPAFSLDYILPGMFK